MGTEGVLFELEGISRQLTENQLEEMKHIIYLARETGKFQRVDNPSWGRSIVVFPSGKMMFDNKRIVGK